MSIPQEACMELIKFRSLMNTNLSEEKARYIWGKNLVKSSGITFAKEQTNIDATSKIMIAKEALKYLLIGNWVKFIGISGSVAAGFAKNKDDIDLFIVVKNNCAWIYRGILVLRNIFHHKIRTKHDGGNVKDKLCINFICEEKDLGFENDMFNFHELMYLIPMYNEKYLNYIYSCNPWLKENYGAKNDLMINRVIVEKNKNIIFNIFNSLAFIFQLVVMMICNHNPEISRLKENFKRGRIEFFPMDYKNKMIESYLK